MPLPALDSHDVQVAEQDERSLPTAALQTRDEVAASGRSFERPTLDALAREPRLEIAGRIELAPGRVRSFDRDQLGEQRAAFGHGVGPIRLAPRLEGPGE